MIAADFLYKQKKVSIRLTVNFYRQQEMLQEHQQVRDALTKKLIDVEAAIDSEESPIG